MVGPLLFIKLLHSRKKFQSSVKKPFSSPKISLERIAKKSRKDIIVKVEPERKCRVCLKEGTIPIYGDQVTEDVSEALISFGGIKIEAGDDFPKYLCNICQKLLQGAILLRKTAQQSEQLLQTSSKLMIENTHDSALRKTDQQCKQLPRNSLKVLTKNIDDTALRKTCQQSEQLSRNSSLATEYRDDSAFAYEDDSIDIEDDPEKQNPFKCKKCEIDFATFKEYCDHRLSEEHQNRRVTCPVCKKSYTKVYYKKHELIHKPDYTFICDICGKKFCVKGHFTKHRLTHFNNFPFECSHCPYRGRFRESLKLHMRSHTGEKPYQCSECTARFANSSNLNLHKLTHKGERNFKCESCDRSFYTKWRLDMHIKVVHVGLKDHLCNLCGKAFGYSKQLLKHQFRVHNRQKQRSGRLPSYLQGNAQGSIET